MDAIETRYLGATNTQPGRIKATTLGIPASSAVFKYNHALNSNDNHRRAAEGLIQRLDWRGVTFVGGDTARGTVWVADIGNGRNIIRLAEDSL